MNINKISEKNYAVSTPEYDRHFWDYLRTTGLITNTLIQGEDNSTGGYTFPSAGTGKLHQEIHRRSVMRRLATTVRVSGRGGTVFAHETNDLAQWVPENQALPIREGMNDFTRYPVNDHKLGVLVKLDEEFVRDAAFDMEDYLTCRLAKNFALAEDNSFINGSGQSDPLGVLHEIHGASVGVIAEKLSYDDLYRLYFALGNEYRPNASWLMNDETALALRQMKDDAGHFLWSPSDNLLLGKPVFISGEMPSVAAGKMPVLFGDFGYYWIIERSPVTVRAIREQFARVGQIGYLTTEFLDGRLVRREAVQGLKIAE